MKYFNPLGAGRQSLTRLAAHIAGYLCFQIELSKNYGSREWRDGIKGLKSKAGVYNRETASLIRMSVHSAVDV
jgi:dynein heavy chain